MLKRETVLVNYEATSSPVAINLYQPPPPALWILASCPPAIHSFLTCEIYYSSRACWGMNGLNKFTFAAVREETSAVEGHRENMF